MNLREKKTIKFSESNKVEFILVEAITLSTLDSYNRLVHHSYRRILINEQKRINSCLVSITINVPFKNWLKYYLGIHRRILSWAHICHHYILVRLVCICFSQHKALDPRRCRHGNHFFYRKQDRWKCIFLLDIDIPHILVDLLSGCRRANLKSNELISINSVQKWNKIRFT